MRREPFLARPPRKPKLGSWLADEKRKLLFPLDPDEPPLPFSAQQRPAEATSSKDLCIDRYCTTAAQAALRSCS
jgi:hypothetical protein